MHTIFSLFATCELDCKGETQKLFNVELRNIANLVNIWQEANSGVGCKVSVLRDTLQIHVLGESVARESRTWGIVVVHSGWHGTRSAV